MKNNVSVEEAWRMNWCGVKTTEEGGRRLLQLPRQEGTAAEHGGKVKDQEII